MKIGGTELDLLGLKYYVRVGRTLLEPKNENLPLLSLQQTEEFGKAKQFSATVLIKDAEYTKDPIFNTESQVTVFIGYQDLNIYKGIYLLDKPKFSFPEDGPCTVALKSVEVGNEEQRKSAKEARDIEQTTFLDFLYYVAGKNKWELDLRGHENDKVLTEKRNGLSIPENTSDYSYLQQLAKEIGYECYIESKDYNMLAEDGKYEPNKVTMLYFYPSLSMPSVLVDPISKKPVKLYYRQGPLLSCVNSLEFSVRTWGKLADVAGTSTVADGRVIESVATESLWYLGRSLFATGDEGTYVKPASQTTLSVSGSDTPELLKSKVDSEAYLSNWNIEATGKMPFYPLLKCGVFVTIDRVGRFSDPDKHRYYFITKVTHTIGESGASTEFSALTVSLGSSSEVSGIDSKNPASVDSSSDQSQYLGTSAISGQATFVKTENGRKVE